jgi:hypothetical protein
MAAPVAYGQRIRQDYSGLDTYVVKHSEFIQDIPGSTDFSVAKLRVNAADPVTFPWLGSLAPNFEKYKFRRLNFMLKPQAPSTTPGVIMMALDYDPTDPAPVAKADMLQYDGAVRVNSWSEQNMSLKSRGTRYNAALTPSDPADVRLSDVANLFLATSGQDSTALVSELWAEYEVELITPQARTECDTFVLNTSSWDQTEAFGSGTVTNPSVNIGVSTEVSSLEVKKAGLYGILIKTVGGGMSIDTSVDDAYYITISVDGVDLNGQRAVAPAGGLPIQNGANSIPTDFLSLLPGQIIKFESNYLSITPGIQIVVYSVDAS